MTNEIHIIKTHPGHSIYDLDLRTQSISVLSNIEFLGGGFIKYDPVENHWYESALNEKTALKKFNKKARYIVTGKLN